MSKELTYQVDGDWERWFDSEHRVHRPEKEGPAVIVKSKDMWSYHKHGKKHRVGGPAFRTAGGLQELYYLEGVELPKATWEWCVTNNKGKPPKKPKPDTLFLKEIAICHVNAAIERGELGGHIFTPEERENLRVAASIKSWAREPQVNHTGLAFEFLLDCRPLDGTLRCYVILDINGKEVRSELVME